MTCEVQDATSWEIGRIDTHCYLIKRGVRAAAMETVNLGAVDEVRKTIRKARLRYAEYQHGENHINFVIFKDKHVGRIFELLEREAGVPVLLRDYIYGKLFGYSEAEIGRFLR